MFISNSVNFRHGLCLYKVGIDSPNITQMVPQINPVQSYAQLPVLIPMTGAAWWIPKSMLFVATID